MKGITIPLRVYYEDTDSAGVVYHANYLKFMERARTEWFRALGFELDELSRDQGIQFVVRSLEITYLQPAKFNDGLEATASIAEPRPMSCTFEQSVRRAGVGSALLSKASVRIACVDVNSFQPCKIPENIVREMTNDG